MEDDQGLAAGPRGVQVDHGASLIRQPDLGKAIALVGADGAEV
jgi:hypothetical protein